MMDSAITFRDRFDGYWFDLGWGGDLPDHWATGAGVTRCGNCGASAASLCSMACPDRVLTSGGRPMTV